MPEWEAPEGGLLGSGQLPGPLCFALHSLSCYLVNSMWVSVAHLSLLEILNLLSSEKGEEVVRWIAI